MSDPTSPDRRTFLRGLGASALVPLDGAMTRPASPAPAGAPCPVRTITAGVGLSQLGDAAAFTRIVSMLGRARAAFEAAGYEVQTARVALPPLVASVEAAERRGLIVPLRTLDRIAADAGALLSIGPIADDDRADASVAPWVAELLQTTSSLSCSLTVASTAHGVHERAVTAAAQVMAALARSTPSGGDNFRFAAGACIPPRTPFFPVAYHEGTDALAIGLQAAPIVADVFGTRPAPGEAAARLRDRLEADLAPIERLASEVARREGIEYAGIDPSPAPAGDRSIGAAIESLTGAPFGSPATLRACAIVTEALKSLRVRTCGYAGLMLPVLEDTVLARRAGEGRYGTRDLLLYSSVCGTGLDVVPLPGDTPVATLAAIVGDVAALAVRLSKPLSARLCLAPGRKAGEVADFANPHLVACAVMKAE